MRHIFKNLIKNGLRSEEIMEYRKNFLLAIGMCIFLIVASFSGCVEEETPEPEEKNIVETAVANEDFNTLVDAVIAAGLDTTLSDESAQFTVFAPTDAAFALLDQVYLADLVNNDTANLTKILTYHVLSGVVMSTDLSDGMNATTVEGSNISITIENSTVYINDAMVTTADIECSNGVIHIIDKVIIP
jgi:uncharacterized surface protein with fasciclin (FAS1) repeats